MNSPINIELTTESGITGIKELWLSIALLKDVVTVFDFTDVFLIFTILVVSKASLGSSRNGFPFRDSGTAELQFLGTAEIPMALRGQGSEDGGRSCQDGSGCIYGLFNACTDD